jgi:hypothetical protein
VTTTVSGRGGRFDPRSSANSRPSGDISATIRGAGCCNNRRSANSPDRVGKIFDARHIVDATANWPDRVGKIFDARHIVDATIVLRIDVIIVIVIVIIVIIINGLSFLSSLHRHQLFICVLSNPYIAQRFIDRE